MFKRPPKDDSNTPLPTTDELVSISQASLIRLRLAAGKIKLHSKRIHAQQGGNYLSAFRGRGMEFDESRAYQPGDDIRNMDWKVMARTGSAHTKVFREERERPVLLWVDFRESMFFATHGVFKSVVAAKAAATIAWAANNQGDRLGGLLFSDRQHTELRPQRGKSNVLHFINQLSGLQSQQPEPHRDLLDAEQALSRLRRVTRPGSLVFLISDFRELGPKAESHITQLARHNDLVMFFIYDTLERQLPPDGQYLIKHADQHVRFNTSQQSRSEYHRHFDQRLAKLKRFARRHGIFLISCSTEDNPLTVLQQSLGQ